MLRDLFVTAEIRSLVLIAALPLEPQTRLCSFGDSCQKVINVRERQLF